MTPITPLVYASWADRLYWRWRYSHVRTQLFGGDTYPPDCVIEMTHSPGAQRHWRHTVRRQLREALHVAALLNRNDAYVVEIRSCTRYYPNHYYVVIHKLNRKRVAGITIPKGKGYDRDLRVYFFVNHHSFSAMRPVTAQRMIEATGLKRPTWTLLMPMVAS
jgi:hypothetical protein